MLDFRARVLPSEERRRGPQDLSHVREIFLHPVEPFNERRNMSPSITGDAFSKHPSITVRWSVENVLGYGIRPNRMFHSYCVISNHRQLPDGDSIAIN
jgi:hypothetical protein